ncbi:tether containing UBX domain for GLUT4 isoform X2 [Calliopsis andreniformis]|uniref:tether containing UBX domain for GLUT4 isoform X2 n=1 Tax=Calliopsis andreniformis TaxID=337506 RepID=UPI003FCDEA24
MATNKTVIVLAPNGRRQNVKVTPNTTILQVLEEVCKKQGYNSDDYDLKHYNRVLDPNAILRFTGLPNNAQLEMVPCTKARSKSNIVIGIQLENGQRLMGEYTPEVTLAEVVQKMCPDQNLERTVLTYMHREVHGTEALENTTLKSLGLINGKAMLRLMDRDPQQMNIQKHVSQPLKPRESPNTSNENDDKKFSNKDLNKIDSVIKKIKPNFEKLQDSSQATETEEEGMTQKDKEKDILTTENDYAMPSTSKNNSYTKPQTQSLVENELMDISDIKFLGERNALVFNQAAIEVLSKDELPNDFYDLTVNDAKVLLRDAKRRREELEDAPLLTTVQRQLNHEKQTLSQLNKYQHTVIRIQFPDQFVLQGVFRPLEKVQTIKDFVKNYLIDSDSDFEIFTTPPKHILSPDAYLVDENLVPSTIVYYSGPSALRSDIKERAANPEQVGRMSRVNQENEIDETVKNSDTLNSKSNETLNKNNKIPKWFNPTSK